jgi:hypothetical protein
MDNPYRDTYNPLKYPRRTCSECGNPLEWDEWNAEGYIHVNDADDTHVPKIAD